MSRRVLALRHVADVCDELAGDQVDAIGDFGQCFGRTTTVSCIGRFLGCDDEVRNLSGTDDPGRAINFFSSFDWNYRGLVEAANWGVV